MLLFVPARNNLLSLQIRNTCATTKMKFDVAVQHVNPVEIEK